jgi:hypothetical protein
MARDPSRASRPEVLRRRREVLVRRHDLLALDPVASSAGPRRRAVSGASVMIVVYGVVIGLVVAGIGVAIHVLGGA